MDSKEFKPVYSQVVVKAVVQNSDGEVLLLRRSKESGKKVGRWDQPGGFLEFGEDPTEGVRREVKEETGLDLESLSLLDVIAYTCDGEYIVVAWYHAKVVSSEVQLDWENDTYRWISPADAQDLDRLPSGHKAQIQKLKSV